MCITLKNLKKLKNLKFKNFLFIIFLFLLVYQIVLFGKLSFYNILTTPTPPIAVLHKTALFRSEFQDNIKNNKTHMKIPSEEEFRMKWIENKIKKLTKNSDKWNLENILNKIAPFVEPCKQIHIFYSTSYRNQEFDGYWSHWKQDLFDSYLDTPKGHEKTTLLTNIDSNFYPLLGCYSSNDPKIIDIHFKQIQNAGIGVIIVSWSPREYTNLKGDFIGMLLNTASNYNISIAFKIEDYKGRNIESVFKNIDFLHSYTKHRSYYKHTKNGVYLPVFYIHESHLIPAVEWRKLLSEKSSLSVRATQNDGLFFGLILDATHKYHIERSLFDGFYTYYASNGCSYGSSWKNWKTLEKFAKEHKLLFLPSVSPGYTDTRVKPWNNALTRHRSQGHYYQAAWRAAISANTFGVTISSFNNWIEGTQIEPATPKVTTRFNYLDYQPEGPLFYLNLTNYWVTIFLNKNNVQTD